MRRIVCAAGRVAIGCANPGTSPAAGCTAAAFCAGVASAGLRWQHRCVHAPPPGGFFQQPWAGISDLAETVAPTTTNAAKTTTTTTGNAPPRSSAGVDNPAASHLCSTQSPSAATTGALPTHADRMDTLCETIAAADPTRPDYKVWVEQQVHASGLVVDNVAMRTLVGVARYADTENERLGFATTVLAPMSFRGTMPLEIIDENARLLFGRRVFGSESFFQKFNMRAAHNMPIVVESPAMAEMTSHSSNATFLIGGASGAGKTMALLGVASTERHIYPVLLQYGDFEDVTENDRNFAQLMQDWRPDDKKKELRNAFVLRVLARLVRVAVTEKVLQAMRDLRSEEGFSELTLWVVVDEAGGERDFLRALCAVTGQQLKEHLGIPQESAVVVRLAACGTGIGGGTISWGSESSNFVVSYIRGDGKHCDVNRKIFEKVADLRHNHFTYSEAFMDVVSSNGRMAAVLGGLMKDIGFSRPPSNDPRPPLRCFDPSSLLQVAAFRFKALNGLDVVPNKEAVTLLVQSLRMHLFPFVPPPQNVYMLQSKYGLVVDSSVPMSDVEIASSNEFAPVSGIGEDGRRLAARVAESRYHLPYFTATVLAGIGDMNVLTESFTRSGNSFEAYWVCASAFAACAAGSAALFTHMLRSGSLAPLSRYRTSDELGVINEAFPSNNFELCELPRGLPECDGSPASFRLQSADLAHFCRSGSDLRSYGAGVRAALSPQSGVQEPAVYDPSTVRVAAIRSPPMCPFADSILFLGNTLYLSQMKDSEVFHWNRGRFTTECAKMGVAVQGENMRSPSDEKALEDAQQLISELKDVWREVSGQEITSVIRCFVTPNEHTFGEGTGNAVAKVPTKFYRQAADGSEVLFVTTREATFLKFASRRTGGSHAKRTVLDEVGTYRLAQQRRYQT